ncbi:7tm Odorant receptor [Popillia japonica]|uniref:7tm Odorant receptor n=1 Tax=Popillia japonica TaxID=7064 RepID=A0AAW1LTN0_POPJA
MPLIDGKLRVPIWYPGESFKLCFRIYEIVCIWMTIATILSTDLLIAGLIHMMSAQMQILNYNLRNITERNSDHDLVVQEKKVQDNLRRCIRHHIAISRLISKLEEIFSFGLFLQILGSIAAICSGGVYIVTVHKIVSLSPSSFLSLVTSITVISLQIAMYFWAGQGLITESDQIRDSCYMSEWYTCNVSTKKIFFIVMERSKKEISFKAGNFFVFSYATFVMVIFICYGKIEEGDFF